MTDYNRFDLIELSDDLPSKDGVRPVRNTVAVQIAAADEKRAQGPWVPACGGTEVPFTTRTGRRLLYCWQPSTGRHAYLDCNTDIILTDEEARLALGTY